MTMVLNGLGYSVKVFLGGLDEVEAKIKCVHGDLFEINRCRRVELEVVSKLR